MNILRQIKHIAHDNFNVCSLKTKPFYYGLIKCEANEKRCWAIGSKFWYDKSDIWIVEAPMNFLSKECKQVWVKHGGQHVRIHLCWLQLWNKHQYHISSDKHQASNEHHPLISAAPVGIHIEISASSLIINAPLTNSKHLLE